MNEAPNLIKSFRQIFNFRYPIGIHKSQRPYVWDTEKVNRLIEDLEQYKKWCTTKKLTDLAYYMSTIVLYKNTDDTFQFEIIDGQQRITTLLLIDYFANDNQSILSTKPEKVNLKYSSNISAKNIQTIKAYLNQEDIKRRITDLKEIIHNQLVFTIVIVKSEDEAFTYFDTQNNRGKKPSIDVVLKAVHLRGIAHNNDTLRKECAEKWESIERYAFHGITVPGSSEGFLYPFIKYFLWRSRNWMFNKASFCDDSKIENTFSRNLSSSNNNNVSFYPSYNYNNQVLNFSTGEINHTSKDIRHFQIDKVVDFPFQLRQPLKKGYEFFLYIEKYALIYKYLFTSEKNNIPKEVSLFKEFYDKVYSYHSEYMKQYYMLCIIMYYDKFKERDLLIFALTLDYLVGTERFSNYYIFEVKYLNINNECNVLDAIQMAYCPDDVISFIINNNTIETKRIGSVNKIITAYLYEILHYYEGGTKKQVPNKITDSKTNKENEISKKDLIIELNQLIEKRKSWLINKIKA